MLRLELRLTIMFRGLKIGSGMNALCGGVSLKLVLYLLLLCLRFPYPLNPRCHHCWGVLLPLVRTRTTRFPSTIVSTTQIQYNSQTRRNLPRHWDSLLQNQEKWLIDNSLWWDPGGSYSKGRWDQVGIKGNEWSTQKKKNIKSLKVETSVKNQLVVEIGFSLSVQPREYIWSFVFCVFSFWLARL